MGRGWKIPALAAARKKRGMRMLLALAAVLMLSACGERTPSAYVRGAQLSKESAVADLLSGDDGACLFDFHAPRGAKSARFRIYKLKGGAWRAVDGESTFAVSAPSGRIALQFDKIPDGVRVSLTGDGVSLHHDFAGKKADTAGRTRAISQLEEAQSAECGREIPLVIQYFSNREKIDALAVDSFYHPEKYGKENGDLIYAVTVTFRTQALL